MRDPGAVIEFRRGRRDDVGALLGLCDEAVAWLTAAGRSGQWGATPWSDRPETVAAMERFAAHEGLWIAEEGGGVVGALVVGDDPPAYAPPTDVPELYVLFLIATRRRRGAGIGAALLAHARALAIERGVAQLRVDCWGGGDGALVAYYASQGFVPTEQVSVKGWPAQILVQVLPSA